MVIGAVIAGVAAVAGTAVNIGMSVKASKEAEAQRKKQEKGLSGQRLASDVMRMKTEDVAGQGGLSAGQYNRSLMQNDVFATQAQGLVNKIESQSVFGDAFRNQSYAKLALSEVGSYTKKTAQGLQDLDTETAIRNAGLAMEGASRLAKTEADILAQETAFKEAEIARKTKIVENISKGIASTASLIGAGVKYAKMDDGVNVNNSNYNPEGNLGLGFNQTLEIPQTLRGVSSLPTTALQAANGDLTIKTGLPSLTGGSLFNYGLLELDANLIYNPYEF